MKLSKIHDKLTSAGFSSTIFDGKVFVDILPAIKSGDASKLVQPLLGFCAVHNLRMVRHSTLCEVSNVF